MARRKFLKLANAINRGVFCDRLDFDANGMFVALDGLKIHIQLDEAGGRLVLWSRIQRVEPDEMKVLADACASYTPRQFGPHGYVLCAGGDGTVGMLGQSIELSTLDAGGLVARIRRFSAAARAAGKFLNDRLTATRAADAQRFLGEMSSGA